MKSFSPANFAKLAGVTVRTLHHYDQIGLLTPVREPEHGWREYEIRDLLRLQQIQTLQWMGLSLAEIKEILNRPTFDIRGSLMVQKAALELQIEQQQKVIAAIEELVNLLSRDGMDDLPPATLGMLIQSVHPANYASMMRKYYNEEALQALIERQKAIPESDIRAAEAEWEQIFAAFERHRTLPPDHPTLQALAAQMDALIRSFTGDHPALQNALRAMYEDAAAEGRSPHPPGAPDLDPAVEALRKAALDHYYELQKAVRSD
jgi:DNA-binding transcriptional MerR regulator